MLFAALWSWNLPNCMVFASYCWLLVLVVGFGCWFWLLRCVVVVPVVPAVPVAFAVAFVVAGAVVVATVSVVVAVLVADVVSRAAAVVFAVVVAVVRAWRLQHLGGTNLHVMSNDICRVLDTIFAAFWNFNLPFLHGICSIVEFWPSHLAWCMQNCEASTFQFCMRHCGVSTFHLRIYLKHCETFRASWFTCISFSFSEPHGL